MCVYLCVNCSYGSADDVGVGAGDWAADMSQKLSIFLLIYTHTRA